MITFETYLNTRRFICDNYVYGLITESECDYKLNLIDTDYPEYYEAAIALDKYKSMMEKADDDYIDSVIDVDVYESVIAEISDNIEDIYESFELDDLDMWYTEASNYNAKYDRSYKKIYRGLLSEANDKIYDVRELISDNKFGSAVKSCNEAIALVEKLKNGLSGLFKSDPEIAPNVVRGAITSLESNIDAVIQLKHTITPKSLGKRILNTELKKEMKEAHESMNSVRRSYKSNKNLNEKTIIPVMTKHVTLLVNMYKENVKKLQDTIKKLEKAVKSEINSDVK